MTKLEQAQDELSKLQASIREKIARGANPRGTETAVERGHAEYLLNVVIPRLQN